MIGFAETLRPTTATAIGHYTGEHPLLGKGVFATHRKVGKGHVIYVGGYLTEAGFDAVLDFALPLAGVQPTLAGPAPTGLVETIDFGTHFAAINNASDPVTIPVQASEVVMGSGLNGNALPLAPMGYALLKR